MASVSFQRVFPFNSVSKPVMDMAAFFSQLCCNRFSWICWRWWIKHTVLRGGVRGSRELKRLAAKAMPWLTSSLTALWRASVRTPASFALPLAGAHTAGWHGSIPPERSFTALYGSLAGKKDSSCSCVEKCCGYSAVAMTGSCVRLAVLEKMTKLWCVHIKQKHTSFGWCRTLHKTLFHMSCAVLQCRFNYNRL